MINTMVCTNPAQLANQFSPPTIQHICKPNSAIAPDVVIAMVVVAVVGPGGAIHIVDAIYAAAVADAGANVAVVTVAKLFLGLFYSRLFVGSFVCVRVCLFDVGVRLIVCVLVCVFARVFA